MWRNVNKSMDVWLLSVFIIVSHSCVPQISSGQEEDMGVCLLPVFIIVYHGCGYLSTDQFRHLFMRTLHAPTAVPFSRNSSWHDSWSPVDPPSLVYAIAATLGWSNVPWYSASNSWYHFQCFRHNSRLN